MKQTRVLIDGREFIDARFTGIGRVICGLADSLAHSSLAKEVVLAVRSSASLPSKLKSLEGTVIERLPDPFMQSENALSKLTNHFDVFISPYPKLPLFGTHCLAAHIIHDVLDLTHPLYRGRFKALPDRYRLKKALHRADLTWYDSEWSMAETRKYFGRCGRNPRVRYPGIHDGFRPEKQSEDNIILETYGLKAGYVLALGNGMPHKNLGIILEVARRFQRLFVFAGVSARNREYWESRYKGSPALWITHVEEQHLPALLRGAFCLVQPSLVEGYGYPPLESMACGKPAIVSKIPVLLETTGNCVPSAPPDDPAEWKKALQNLEDSSWYGDLIEKGLKWTEVLRGQKAWKPYLDDIEDLRKGT